MARQDREPPLLAEMFPLFSRELQQLPKDEGESDLASQVPGLRILDRCRCGDDFCASFYTQPKPDESYGPSHRCLALEPGEGMLILDVVGGVIAHIEILYRNDIRQKLLAALP